ncbi:MAG: GNAT family N-acetyltransferase [Proteobacteria bacterium]|nr:MAG: GNAT family N-acetyltransferase [Pseudomonadota bacterium]
MQHQIITNKADIDVERLSKMYKETDLGERIVNQLLKAIENSTKVIVLEYENQYVGAGRSISDGIYTLFVDIAVVVEYKGRGLGKTILDELLKGEEKNFVYLNSTWEAEPFYQKFGFKRQKTGYARYPFKSEYLE